MRITPSGTKSFVFKYKTKDQKDRWITIGQYPEWSIRQARREYDTLYEKVYDYGCDIVQEQKDQKEKEKSRETVKEFAKVYIGLGYLKNKKFTVEEERYFDKDICPVIGGKFLDEVTSGDIEEIQNNIIERASKMERANRSGRVAVKHAVACVRRLFDLAIKKGLVETNPVKNIEALGITGSRDRVMDFKEIWLFWNNLEGVGTTPVIAKALKFELVTMQRSKEVRNMRYDALKIDENVWQMERADTKNKKSIHRVPLNSYAKAIIDDVSAYTGKSEFVFGSTKARKPPQKLRADLKPVYETSLSHAMHEKLEAMGIDGITPHDMRRSGATWITAVGLPKLYARLMLNHSDGENDVTGEVYVQYSYDFEKRRASKVWEFVLDNIVRCKTIEEIPTLEEMRKRVQLSGVLHAE
jgi:integrase